MVLSPFFILTLNISGFELNEDNNSIIFPITKSQCQTLYANVIQLETMLAEAISTLDMKDYYGLSYHCYKVLSDYPQSNDQIVCSNYDNDTINLKGTLETIQFRDFAGNHIDYKSLGTGLYKFIISANLAYFGPHHKNLMQITSLQLRISEVHFRPADTSKKSTRPHAIKKGVRLFPNLDTIPTITNKVEADSDNDIVCDCPCGALGFNNHTY